MGLKDALFTGISGLKSLSYGMSVIGDNVSNLNTTAFKATRITFSDVMAQNVITAAGSGQLGRGVSVQNLCPQFTQGTFESSVNPTDIAIAGNGFFIVRNPYIEGGVYYTRDGQFTIDKAGYLVTPQGFRVQGWKIDENTNDIRGALTDIRIDITDVRGELTDIRINRSSPPVETSKIDMITNLDAREKPRTQTQSLVDSWDPTNDPPIPTTAYAYSSSLFIYDSLGTPHEITIYYAPTTNENEWEFLVVCNPNEDQREFVRNNPDHDKKGVLMFGKLKFDSQGDLEKLFDVKRINTTNGNEVDIIDTNGNPISSPTDGYDALGENGYPLFLADFLSIEDEEIQEIELNLGYSYKDGNWEPESVRTTQYSSANATLFYDQNGFAPGYLERITVDNQGRIKGVYSNGRVVHLWMVGLANFNAPEKLQKVGNNLFKETIDSGLPIKGKPGTNGLGTIVPNSLEQSNVDLGEQFVKMIIFQRGFQADSRIITVSDSMLEELINLKR